MNRLLLILVLTLIFGIQHCFGQAKASGYVAGDSLSYPPNDSTWNVAHRDSLAEKDYVFPEDTVASAKKIIKVNDLTDSLIFEAYGSIRINAGASFSGYSEIQNGASRIGFKGKTKMSDDIWALMQVELGLRIVDNNSKLVANGDPGGSLQELDNTVTTRLGILGVQTKYGSITWGKQWSPHYNVAVFTDELNAFGGEAAGTFNRGSDGAVSGTGRASYAAQYGYSYGPVNILMQMQNRSLTKNNQKLADSYCGSLVYNSDNGLSLGVSYSQVLDGVDDPTLEESKTDDETAIFGASFKNEHMQFGATYCLAYNHETDDSEPDSLFHPSVFFDNYGVELFAEYTLNRVWSAYGGFNYLKPFDSYKGLYKIEYYAFGAKYAFINASFVFVEVKFEESLSFDGKRKRPSVIGFGMFYNF
jgi:predicted porin